MVIFFFSLCLLLLLLLLLVLTGTDVNIHPIPHLQKSFAQNPIAAPFAPAQYFACQSPPASSLPSTKPPLFMDNPSEIPHSSIKMPLFMDNLIKIPLPSTKPPLFMDNLINSRPLSTKSPVFMDNLSEISHSSMKPHNIEYGKYQKAVGTVTWLGVSLCQS